MTSLATMLPTAVGMLSLAAALSAKVLDETQDAYATWREIRRPCFTVAIGNAGTARVIVDRCWFSFPSLAFFLDDKSYTLTSPLHGTGAWESITGEINETPSATVVHVRGVVGDAEVVQTFRITPEQADWEFTLRIITPTPTMRWLRFEGALWHCTCAPFSAQITDGTIRRGVLLDAGEFREMANVARLEVSLPKNFVTMEWREASRIKLWPNKTEKQPHIPLRYSCAAANQVGADAQPALMPGQRAYLRMRITVAPR